MKKILLFIALCLATVAMTAQTVRTLTFEDTAGSNYWGSKIDSPQYGGPLLYPSGSYIYTWCDSLNTKLRSAIPANYGEHKYWGGGVAISNYWNGIESEGDYLHQLSVYVPNNQNSGINGHGYDDSNNFAVHFGYKDGSPYNFTENLPYIEFSDGIARKILGMYVNNTTYFVNVAKNGNDFSPAMSAGKIVNIEAKAYKADGTTQTKQFTLAYNTVIKTDWEFWSLASFGQVYKIEFNVVGNVENEYGFSLPAYFCYDNILVEFPSSDSMHDVSQCSTYQQPIMQAKATSNGVKKMLITITDKNESHLDMTGDIPEGCSCEFEYESSYPTLLEEGNKNKLTIKGMPENATITGISVLANCESIFGATRIVAISGDKEISKLEYCGIFMEGYGIQIEPSGSCTWMDMPLNEGTHKFENRLDLIAEGISEYSETEAYEISYTLDDPTGINEVFDNGEEMHPNIFTIDGRQVQSTTNPGLYIINGKKTFVK